MSYGEYEFPVVEKIEQEGITLTIEYEQDTEFANPRQWTQVGRMAVCYRGYSLGDSEEELTDGEDFEIDCPHCEGSANDPNRFELFNSYEKIGAGTEASMNSEYDRLVRIWENDHPAGEGHGRCPYTVYPANCLECEGEGKIIVDPATYFRKERGARVVIPLFVYEHSGITMRAGAPVKTLTREDVRSSGRFMGDDAGWDTSFVGFIFDTPETLKETMGDKATDEEIIKALEGEVEEYASYLEGEVYYYSIEDEDGEHLDSCGGFVGDEKYALEEGKASLKHYVEKKRADQAEQYLMACRDIDTIGG